MRKKDRKILENGKCQYLLTVLVTLVVLVLIVVYTFGSFYTIARQDALTLGEQTVTVKSERLSLFLMKGLDVLQVTARTVDYMLENGAGSEEIEDFLQQQSADYAEYIAESFTGIYGLFHGLYIDGIGWVPEEGYVPKTRPWYVAAVENGGEPTIVPPYVDAQTGDVMISVSQLLSDGESVIALDINMDEMQDYTKSLQQGGKGYGFIIDDTGFVAAHSDLQQKGKNYLSDADMQGSEMNALVKQIVEGNSGTIDMQLGGEYCVVFSRTVHDSWHVVMVLNERDLFEQVENNLLRNIFLAFIIFGIVAYFCAANYRNREKATQYAAELKNYQLTLEKRVREQTEEIRRQSERMVKLQRNVVERMAVLIEKRDGSTGEHVQNTKAYVSMIVNYMYAHKLHPEEVTREFADKLIQSAVLHDVGKIRIPDTVLNKPGRFTPEEFSIMKNHASLGGMIVEDILGEDSDEELVQIAMDIASFHHEKWDGSGYPMGLKGTDIPLSARIMAVADVFDALVSKRVYKESISVEETFLILQAEAGTHFDPELIEIFNAIRPEVESYYSSL